MVHFPNYRELFPQIVPQNMNGTQISAGVRIKKDYIRKDGTAALYMRLYQKDCPVKKIPLEIYVEPKLWDERQERLKKKHPQHQDLNLLIEQKLADINRIQVEYRLQKTHLTIDLLLDELNNPTSRLDFIVFYEEALAIEKEILAAGTYRQQKSCLEKIKKYSPTLSFANINNDWLKKFRGHLKTKEKNQNNTISTTFKNIKKYLNLAKKSGIRFNFDPSDIKVKSFSGHRTSLTQEELDRLDSYRLAHFTNETHKIITTKFIFCCLTGIRLGDFMRLSKEDIIGDYILNYNQKSDIKQKLPITDFLMEILEFPFLFENVYTPEYMNQELKAIAKVVGIKKRLTWHVSRHTFASQYLAKGGNIEILQKILGHSSIKTTMIYSHDVQDLAREQMNKMSSIFKSSRSPDRSSQD